MKPDTPNTAAAVLSRLRAWAMAQGWTKTRFAAEAGLVDTTLRDFDKPDWNPTRETLEKLEAVVPKEWQAGASTPAAKRSGGPRNNGTGRERLDSVPLAAAKPRRTSRAA